MSLEIARYQITVNGIVQGVGFRPFIYKLATGLGLVGFIYNDSSGVCIEVQGVTPSLTQFVERVSAEKPQPALIIDLQVKSIPTSKETTFYIKESQAAKERSTLISPDLALCEDCLRELFDPLDRRFGYPFINCTNCGPRFTIIRDIPYDRANTSMDVFPMCQKCAREYADVLDRRFHAQPNACWVCGPQLSLYNNKHEIVETEKVIQKVVALLKESQIIAIKGLGGFHLAVDARNDAAILRLRQLKARDEKPFAVMAADVEAISGFAAVSGQEVEVLRSAPHPIVLLKKRIPFALSEYVAPKNNFIGTLLAYTPIHHLILRGNFSALVMTSANFSNEPIVSDNEEAFSKLSSVVDYFLIHNRAILVKVDDSVARYQDNQVRMIRRSRGYTPNPVFLPFEIPSTLAVGGELKSTLCLTRQNQAYLSQHIGDLENKEALEFFTDTIEYLKKILQISPEVIAYDLHPGYLSTQYALAQKSYKSLGVQHHHAHIAAGMAENGLKERVIGLAMDGTGYGTDEQIWGGEFLIADYRDFIRAFHFAYLPLPGGAMAIKEGYRMGVSVLDSIYGEDLFQLQIPFLDRLSKQRIQNIVALLQSNIQVLKTSSLGRLFDAAASLCGVSDYNAYEGQAPMIFESVADQSVTDSYPCTIPEKTRTSISLKPVFQALVADIQKNTPVALISARFHNSLAQIFVKACQVMRQEFDIRKVVLSGGCFQNGFLLHLTQRLLTQAGFAVYTHSKVPANDGGLALGQAAIAGGYYGQIQ